MVYRVFHLRMNDLELYPYCLDKKSKLKVCRKSFTCLSYAFLGFFTYAGCLKYIPRKIQRVNIKLITKLITQYFEILIATVTVTVTATYIHGAMCGTFGAYFKIFCDTVCVFFWADIIWLNYLTVNSSNHRIFSISSFLFFCLFSKQMFNTYCYTFCTYNVLFWQKEHVLL